MGACGAKDTAVEAATRSARRETKIETKLGLWGLARGLLEVAQHDAIWGLVDFGCAGGV